MARILILYGTTEGQTAKIAEFIKSELTSDGHQVDLLDSSRLSEEVSVFPYDGVIIGASVHRSQFPSPLKSWVKAHVSTLSRKPGAFFSVCLGILEKNNIAAQQAERNLVTGFLRSAGWTPSFGWRIFPGALLYTQYGWVKRQMMRSIVGRAGGAIDIHKDYEYTNWEEVRQFAKDFSASFSEKQVRPAARRLG